VDRIGPDGVEIVMRQVDDMGSARSNSTRKTGIIHMREGTWHPVNTGMAGHK
jgi:hypothetical protein